jgi:hypothetical protein
MRYNGVVPQNGNKERRMTQNLLYQISQPEVVFENFGDEIVIINLDNGNYYSIDNVAANIWEFIERGYNRIEIMNEIVKLYVGDLKTMQDAVGMFIEELHQEGLIRTGSATSIMTREQIKDEGGDIDLTKIDFALPALNRYTDMQDLLLLDPIHEVDDTGWPNPLTDTSK